MKVTTEHGAQNHLHKVLCIAVLVAMAVSFAAAPEAHAVRIKDLANIQGVRANQIMGYGLVVGLQGTGDGTSARFTVQSVVNMLSRMGIRVEPKDVKTKNVAAVVVTASLPAFASSGDTLDVVVSSLGDAKSLAGGMLLFTPLKGADRNVYAVAQGSVTTGSVGAGDENSSALAGILNVGRVTGGAIVEREIKSEFFKKGRLVVSLKQADFTTASRTATAINLALGNEIARAKDAGTVHVMVPDTYKERATDFVAAIERIDVAPDRKARVVINERSGTIVIGSDVRVSTVAISQGSLSIEVKKRSEVTQPYPYSNGTTEKVDNTEIKITEKGGKVHVVPGGIPIGELAKALNALGVSTRQLGSIFQALKTAGALDADIIIQ